MAKCSGRLKAAWLHLRSCWRPLDDLRSLVGLPPSAPPPPALLPAVSKPSSACAARSGPRRIGYLDGIRALALLWVLATHAAQLGALGRLSSFGTVPPGVSARWVNSWVAQPITNGDLGVDMFFTLSGVLIATMWLREVKKNAGRFSYVRFAARRWMRLAPMLVVGMLTHLLVGHLDGSYRLRLNACARDWWLNMLMVNNYTGTDACLVPWAIAIEFQLYLLAPLLLWAAWNPSTFEPRPLWWLRIAAAWLLTPLLRMLQFAAEAPGGISDSASYFPVFHAGWQGHLTTLPLSYKATYTRAAPFIAGMGAALAVAAHKQRAADVGGGSGSAAADGSPPQQAVKDAAKDVEQQQHAGGAVPGDEAPARRGRRLRQGLLLGAIDALALALLVVLAFFGAGDSRRTSDLCAVLDFAVTMFGRPLFGAALAWVLGAIMLGRLRALAAVLSLRLFLPAAGLSYGAYLLQILPMLALPSWASVGVTTLFAAWAVFFFEFGYFVILCLAVALPFSPTIEMPLQRVIRRGY